MIEPSHRPLAALFVLAALALLSLGMPVYLYYPTV